MITEPDSDARLLERFARRREEAAFRELVERHGPRVLRVCRRMLACDHDVQDVFQATFLTLARKAGRVSWTGSAGPWLGSVARRLALHARGSLVRQRARERTGSTLIEGPAPLPDFPDPAGPPDEDLERRELRQILDGALGRLPDKYREPIVLCYLEGMTNDEAARRLGWPSGSMSRRLERARALLRRQLVQSGVTASLALFLAAAIAWQAGPAMPVPGDGQGLRLAMRAFATTPGSDPRRPAVGEWVAGLGRDASSVEQLADFARKAEKAAVAASEHVPDFRPGRARWRTLAAGMLSESRALAEAGRAGDRDASVAAARRLDSTCVSCHLAFRH
ncbi:sigma-70 family RNA polymerase sigma factor [Aquisphaera insulae]|uniref:sigma-70 family RNA polymerase sigma factor n=1 Tax=Aquisphaera insulae TaxID=2712864 RepID=UPI0013EA5F77|nr:sigma-70 family RNA polymerase sigma factor [Aquisphaera insulae]